jgi:phosphotransferase system  glucose/maltose/N-acetylglucosamine-specific IIC component
MEEVIFFFGAILSLVSMAIWVVLGVLCGIWIDIVILQLLGIDHSRCVYPGSILKMIATVGLYAAILSFIKTERGEL